MGRVTVMNRRLAMAGVWCTGGFFVVWAVGYAGLAQWIPPLSPDLSAQATADAYSDHATSIRLGMVLMTLGAVLYLPWTVLLAQIIRQVERGGRMLCWTQLLAGVVAALTFMLPAYIWAAISFRGNRDPQAFPRWVGYLQIWVSLSFLPAALAFFFKTGPFAWNGLMVWWVPLTTFSAWFAVIIYSANRAVRRGFADPEPVGFDREVAHA